MTVDTDAKTNGTDKSERGGVLVARGERPAAP
jgi:hypothetical protein